MPVVVRHRHLVLAIAAACIVAVAIVFVMRGSKFEHAAADVRPAAVPVVAATSEPATRLTSPATLAASPRPASTAASSSVSRSPAPRAPDTAAKTDSSQWKSWRDAPPIDRDDALDRLADWAAMEKEGKSDENSVQWNRKFESHPVDAALTDEVNANIRQSFANLDADVQQHFTLGSVECRGNTCQVLAAVNGYVYDEINNTSQSPLNIQQMYDAMTGQPWWSQSGWEIRNTSVYLAEGYTLYEIYFVRPTK